MKNYTAIITFRISDKITEEEFKEWFNFEILNKNGCSSKNPLIDIDKYELIKDCKLVKNFGGN